MKHRFTATILAALSPTVGIAATVAPAYLQSPAPQQLTIRVAEQAQARPGSAGSGGCYVQEKWDPNGANVPLDPDPDNDCSDLRAMCTGCFATPQAAASAQVVSGDSCAGCEAVCSPAKQQAPRILAGLVYRVAA